MPLLSKDQLKDVVERTLTAAAVDDTDRVVAAMAPLWKPTGDFGDGLLFTMMMITATLHALPVTCWPGGTPGDGASVEELAYRALVRSVIDCDPDKTIAVFHDVVESGHAYGVMFSAVQRAGLVVRRHIASLQ